MISEHRVNDDRLESLTQFHIQQLFEYVGEQADFAKQINAWKENKEVSSFKSKIF